MGKVKPYISYYGGKQRMAPKILPYIPKHLIYVEPFAGGLALLFAKGREGVPGSYQEIINDTNQDLINFYRVISNIKKRRKLLEMIIEVPLSDFIYQECKNKIKEGDEIERAFSYWYCQNNSFGNKGYNAGFAFSNVIKLASKYYNKKKNIIYYRHRLDNVQIFNREALKIIDIYDKESTFLYLDPPYINTDQGRYFGYTKEDYDNLIDRLESFKGSFILSHYSGLYGPKNTEEIKFKTKMTVNAKDQSLYRKREESIYIRENGNQIGWQPLINNNGQEFW